MLPAPDSLTTTLAAINAGHNTIDLLAAHLGVPAASYNLRADLRQLTADGRIRVVDVTADGTRVFAPTPPADPQTGAPEPMSNYTTVITAEQVTDEILTAAENIYDGWWANEDRIDWQDFIDRLDGSPLDDGTSLDLGDDMTSPAIRKIKAHVNAYRKL
jgi:hypothetical protein